MNMQEEIRDVMNEAIAKKLAEKVMDKVNIKLRQQWVTVVSELVSTRKANRELTAQINRMTQFVQHVEKLLAKRDVEATKNKVLQQKEERILNFLVNEFGIKPEES